MFWPLQSKFWSKFDEIQKNLHLNEEQIRLLEYFAMLSNHLIQREAREEIKKKSKTNPDIFLDKNIFFCVVVLMMSFLRYKFDVRRHIYSYFDKFMNSPNIFTIMDSNSCYNSHII